VRAEFAFLPRGFAFVECENEEDAARAIEKFNGYELSGRALRVNAAKDRPRGSGGGPPRGGGGYGAGGYGGGGYGGGSGGWGGERFPPGGTSKGSRRNIRGKKRSL
jgi:RNA recognition motif-containing protein